ncbi:MAG TPA: SAM-dependent methyltransferase [Herpetosiphonaceae bacterium]
METDSGLRVSSRLHDPLLRPSPEPQPAPAPTPPLSSLGDLNTAFLELAMEQLAGNGCAQFIDLGSGALAREYRRLCPPSARVVYHEPRWELMAGLRPRLRDDPQVLCLDQPLAEIDEVLLAANNFFGASRKIICHLGAAPFLEDGELRLLLHRLYDWAAPTSCVAVAMLTSDEPSPELEDALALAREMGQPMFVRTSRQCAQLLKPWRVLEPGLRSLVGWCVERGRLPAAAAAGLTGDLTVALLSKPAGGMR